MIQRLGRYLLLLLCPIIMMGAGEDNSLDQVYKLRQAKKYPEAIALLEPLVAASAQNAQTSYELGSLYTLAGEYAKAKKMLLAANKLRPQSGPIQHELAVLYRKVGDIPKAYNYYRKMLDYGLTNKQVILEFAGFLDAIRDYRSLLALLENPPSLEVSHDRRSQYYLALALARTGRYKQARECLKPLHAATPQSFTLAMLEASIDSAQGNLAAAVSRYIKAGKLKPKDPRVDFALARIYDQQKNFTAAHKSYQQAYDKGVLSPDKILVLHRLTELYWQQKQATSARKYAQKLLLALPPDSPLLPYANKIMVATAPQPRAR